MLAYKTAELYLKYLLGVKKKKCHVSKYVEREVCTMSTLGHIQ